MFAAGKAGQLGGALLAAVVRMPALPRLAASRRSLHKVKHLFYLLL
jgi:hypothetical protein